jgi:hypothetical protein
MCSKWIKFVALTLAVATAATACSDEVSEAWDEPLQISEPVQANGDLLFVNRSFEQVMRLRPTRDGSEINLAVERAPTGTNPGTHALSADGSQFYVVNESTLDGEASLSVYDLADGGLSLTEVGLDSAYDRLSVDPEGDFLLLSFTGDSGDYIARNLNELGIVDLRDGLGDEATADFETLSSRARGIVFAPSFELGGEAQRLAVALSPSEINIVDLLADDASDRLRVVPLTVSQADRVRTPTQAIFDVAPRESMPETASIYLLTDTGQDITHVAIQPALDPDADRKFDISINQLAAGDSPVRMKLLDLGEQGARLIAIDGQRARFTMIDIQSGESSTFDLPMTAPAEDLLVYRTTKDGEPETRVLAWSSRSPLVSVIRPESIAISDDAPTLGRSVEAVRLQAAPSRVRLDEIGGGERAIVHHSGLGSGFTVLNLHTNRAIPIQGAALGDIYFGASHAYGVFRGEAHFGAFDLQTGHPSVFSLPKEGQRIHLIDDQELIMVQHGDAHGSFTLLNAVEPRPKNARHFDYVFFDELFAQELP